jgi:uncharacterized protein (AIM24 family)
VTELRQLSRPKIRTEIPMPMAEIQIIEEEGVRLTKFTLNSETVRTEAGALYYMRGAIRMQSNAPSIGGVLKAFATGESVFRPTYSGSGELFLEPSLGGFTIIEMQGEEWILENGAYWASEEAIELDIHREKALTAFKSGEGFLDFQTKVRGRGKLVIKAQGPVEHMHLESDRLVVDGRYVVGRAGSLNYAVERATKSLFGAISSGEGFVRVYEGTGDLLIAPVPYWRQRLYDSLSGLAASKTR